MASREPTTNKMLYQASIWIFCWPEFAKGIFFGFRQLSNFSAGHFRYSQRRDDGNRKLFLQNILKWQCPPFPAGNECRRLPLLLNIQKNLYAMSVPSIWSPYCMNLLTANSSPTILCALCIAEYFNRPELRSEHLQTAGWNDCDKSPQHIPGHTKVTIWGAGFPSTRKRQMA